MKFNRLRIHGFKTFVEAADVPIENGLTGIVGPNGCGKSNLVESLRWVMGENSFKNMRASGMDDVIFSGSGQRPSRNTAEVMLVVDNHTRTAPAPFNDADLLEVSRRITREAGSTYRVNGREVRARDVQLLFADASTGARSPALVRQGQIAEIINAKPQARRRVLEEAAGIAGLYARRHEAETRLKAAEVNLDRLEDVLSRIEGELDGLKRQARQAIRYRGLSADIRKVEAAIHHARHREARAAVIDARATLEEAQKAVDARTLAQAEAAKKQAVAAYHLPALRDEATKAGILLQGHVIAREQLDGEERRIRERLRDLEQRIIQLGADRAREQALAADAGAVVARLTAEAERLTAEGAGAAERDANLKAQLAEAEARLASAEATLGEATAALAGQQAIRTQVERAAREAADRLARIMAQTAQLERDHAALAAQTGLAEAAERARAAFSASEAALATAEREALAAEQALQAASRAESDTRRPVSDADRQVQRLEGEVRALTKLLAPASGARFPAVADQISVDKGFEIALGAALGDDLDASTSAGAPFHWAGAEPAGDSPLPEGAVALIAHVKAPAALHRRLAQIGLVARADGPRLQPLLTPGQRLVSREGDLWRWDGLTAAAHAPTAAARRLAEKNRLVDLELELAGARLALEAARKQAKEAADRLKAAQMTEQRARETTRSARQRLDAERQTLSSAERAANDHASRLTAIIDALDRLAPAIAEAEAEVERSADHLATLGDTRALEQRLAHAKADVGQNRADVAERRADWQGLTREAAERQRRLAAIAEETTSWQARRDGSAGQTMALEARLAEAEAERASLAASPDDFALRRREIISAIQDAESAQRAATDRLLAGEAALGEVDRAARAALEALAAAREQAGRSDERLASLKGRLEESEAAIVEAFGVGADGLPRIGEFDPAKPPILKAQEEAHAALLRERDRLGAVNLRADQELKDVHAQFDGMVKERDDLIEAIRKLRGAIGSLNREGRERLLASFEVVNGNFQRLFAKLFNGGTAELQLVESDDPLEAGLDILARPPGKKPQTLSLLSGGEQALTAIALIFAVFLTNPAPICVLDEVDAPLDDANVERYCDMLDEMASMTATRFLIITHNPITMSRMDRLYGVTMVEKGVSQLVSVDLDHAERLAAE